MTHQNMPLSCSREATEHMIAQLSGYQAELKGHERDGHTRAHLGRSFGRPEGEIQEDIDRVENMLVQCNNQLHQLDHPVHHLH